MKQKIFLTFFILFAITILIAGFGRARLRNNRFENNRLNGNGQIEIEQDNTVGANNKEEATEEVKKDTEENIRKEAEEGIKKEIVQADFKNKANWEAFDAGNINGLLTRGYFGAAFDGRYVYYAPCRTQDFHGIVLRYDTTKPFKSKTSWGSYDAGFTDGLNTKGYAGAIFDGRYVYFVPFATSDARHARVLRYDTKSNFTSSSSWSAFDAQKVAGKNALGYDGAIFDGRYVYFAPFGYEPYAHAKVLRLDTMGDFKALSSWKVYDAAKIDNLDTKGYYGAVFDGRFAYFVPFNDGKDFHGKVLRYDTKGNFEASSSWSAYDAGNTEGKKTIGYKGAVFDGKYIYFVPFRNKDKTHALVLRYDTEGGFKNESSWSVYDAKSTDGLSIEGYVGAEFDGRFAYFVPYSDSNNVFHANFLRYDTKNDFKTSSSWSAFDGSSIDGLITKGYKYSTSDGEYIYFAPYNNNKTFSGFVLRYKISE